MKNINVATNVKSKIGKRSKTEKPKHVLKSIPSVKIIVNRVYVKGKPMDKAFSDYLSQQIDAKGK